jgi:hypothetical protein
VIRVLNIPANTWALTAILLLSGTYHFLQAIRSRQRTDRINQALHTLMHVLMAAMLWNLLPSTMLAQIAVLAGAALWFVIQAVARPEFKVLCAGSQARIKCLHHGVSMAGAALTITMMTSHLGTGPGTGPAHAAPLTNAHHAPTGTPHTATLDTATTAAGIGHAPAILLTIVFAAAATFLILLLRRHPATTHQTTTRQRATRTEHGLEAFGAVSMAFMCATVIP